MHNKVELLAPVQNFDCLKAAVQNGADAIYLGSKDFNARNSATNFSIEDLESAIDYAHLRNVKVYLTLNTLIKNNEFEDAINLALKAYSFGIDGIIIQDLGLANYLAKHYPYIPLHASTQMTCHNLSGVQYLENMGFKRIVLARELSLNNLEYIKLNTSCELEVFVHGALCISYSGSCLYSSIVGGRSGNRGKCAQACRLPYKLLKNKTKVDEGYLLSPRDLSSLELLPQLINTGIDSLKIEGRMKSPEYVATVVKIYKKYINKIYNNEKYAIELEDKEALLQVFNRGNFSNGHFDSKPNLNLVFKEKPNNTGIYLGHISNYNKDKGIVTLTLNNSISIGDSITFEKENSKYHISELMKKNENIRSAYASETVKLGRMKGNINIGDKVFKLESKSIIDTVRQSINLENIKIPLHCSINLALNQKISLTLSDDSDNKVTLFSDEIPIVAQNFPITKERLIYQLNKTTNTPFYFKDIKVNMEDNLFVPHISNINKLRRNAIAELSNIIVNKYKKTINKYSIKAFQNSKISSNNSSHKLCLLLSNLNINYDYSKLCNIDKLYIPLAFFIKKDYSKIINELSDKFNTYIYMPIIMKDNFRNIFSSAIENAVENYNIKGFVISNIGNLVFLENYKNLEFIANYSFNIFNNETINSLENVNTVTISPELNINEINDIAKNSSKETEFIVYGNLPLMTLNYCLLGNTNKCYPTCSSECNSSDVYWLSDRLNYKFKIRPDNLQTVTTIYNSKITSVIPSALGTNNYRIDIIDESIEEINNIISLVKNDKKLEGLIYTNGNLNRII